MNNQLCELLEIFRTDLLTDKPKGVSKPPLSPRNTVDAHTIKFQEEVANQVMNEEDFRPAETHLTNLLRVTLSNAHLLMIKKNVPINGDNKVDGLTLRDLVLKLVA